MPSDSCRKNDLVSRKIGIVLWGLPTLFLVIGILRVEARLWLWTPALLVMGAACVANVVRCKRLHCYFTGPLFLLGAAATMLRGLNIVALPWSWIGYALLGGTLAAFVPEWIRGKYTGTRSTEPSGNPTD